MDNFRKVKDEVSLLDYIGLTVDLKKYKDYSTGFCPKHEDKKNRSLVVYQGDDGDWRWMCKGECNQGGDIFDWARFIGQANDNVDAMYRIAEHYNIEIEKGNKPATIKLNIESLKNDITTYAHKLLMSNQEAKNFLHSRGLTEEIIKRWKIGISDGRLYEYFRTVYKNEDGPLTNLLVESGIASKDKQGRVYNFIRENILMYPVYVGREISHWDLRECSKEKKFRYQIPSEKRQGGLFFNQNALANREVWLTEGRDDVIALKEIAGKHAVGLFGGGSEEQLAYLQSLIEFGKHTPQAGKDRVWHLILDGDKPGFEKADRLGNNLIDYGKVLIYEIPDEKDAHKFLLDGGDLNSITSRPIRKSSSRIKERHDKYYLVNATGETRAISNFVIMVQYVIEKEDFTKEYIVSITFEGEKHGPFVLSSKGWASETRFREWLGQCDGRYALRGGKNEVAEIQRYMFEAFEPKHIKIFDGYGEVIPGIRLFDNCALFKGKRIDANDMGVSWIGDGRVDGVKTQTWGETKQFVYPQEFNTLKWTLEGLRNFYETPRLIWTALGFAAYSIFVRPISEELGSIALLFATGRSQSGKTKWAEIIRNMTGGCDIPPPDPHSTPEGIAREGAKYCGFAYQIDEFRGDRFDGLVRGWHDMRFKISGRKTNDNRTKQRGYGAAGIFTNIHTPLAEDVINRLLIMEFETYFGGRPDPAFTDFIYEGGKKRKHAIFLDELMKTDIEFKIVPTIKKVRKTFIETSGLSDARQIDDVSAVAGAFVAAGRALKLWPIFEELEMLVPTVDSVVKIFSELSHATTKLAKEGTDMHWFFEVFQSLFDSGVVHKWALKEEDGGGEFYRFWLSPLFPQVKEAANRQRLRQLDELTQRHVSLRLRQDLDCSAQPGWLPEGGASHRLHKVYLHEIREKYGVQIHSDEEYISGDPEEAMLF